MGSKLSKEIFKRKGSDEVEEELEEVETERISVKYSVPLNRATQNDFDNFGLSDNFTGVMRNLQDQGKIEVLSNIVSVIEKNSLPYEVQVEGRVLLRVNSEQQIVIEQASPHSEDKESLPTSSHKDPTSIEYLPPSDHNKCRPTQSNDEPSAIDGKINLNSAGAETLEVIKGIGPVLAVRIIEYRNTHGPFSQIEDLTAVRGVSKRLLQKIQPHLTLEYSRKEEKGSNLKNRGISTSGWRESFRWISSKVVETKFNNRDVVRLASWNLLRFSSDKVANDGVREVVCRTIIENGINILAVQEIGDAGALEQIRDELNKPSLKAVKKCRGNHRQWECRTSDVAGYMFRSKEFNGFLWDASLGIELKSADLLEKPTKGKKQFARRPFLGYFKAKEFDFILVSVHLKAAGLENEDISRLQEEIAHVPDLVQALHDHVPGEQDTIIVGDFNLGPEEKEFESLRASGHENVIPGSIFTNISVKNMYGSKCYDNMWIARETKRNNFTTRTGVIRHGLRHQAIPDGWKWNGLVSDHCPVWAEFYCDRDHDDRTGEGNLAGISIGVNK